MLLPQKLVGRKFLPAEEECEEEQPNDKQQGRYYLDKHIKILSPLGILKPPLLLQLTLLVQIHLSLLLLFLYILLDLKADLSH